MAPAPTPMDPFTIAMFAGVGAFVMLFGGVILLRPSWLLNLHIRMLEWQQRHFGFGKGEIEMFRGRAGPVVGRLIGLFTFAMGAVFVAIVALGAGRN